MALGDGGTDGVVADWEEWNRHLRRVAGWLETALDVVAWRVRCAREGVVLSWPVEAEKGRAVIRALARLGLLTPETLSRIRKAADVGPGLPDIAQEVELWTRVLQLRFDGLVGRDGGNGLKAGTRTAMAIARGSYLPAAAALLAVDGVESSVGRWLMAGTWWDLPGNVEARVVAAEADDGAVARAARQEGSRDPSVRLSVAAEELAAARGEVARLKSLVHRLGDAVWKQGRRGRGGGSAGKSGSRRSSRPAGSGLFEGGGGGKDGGE